MTAIVPIQIRLSNEERDKLHRLHHRAKNTSLNKIVNMAIQEYLSLEHWLILQKIVSIDLSKNNEYCFQSRLDTSVYHLLHEAKKEAKTTMNAVARVALLHYIGCNTEHNETDRPVSDQLDRIVAIDKTIKQLEAEKTKIVQSLKQIAC